MPWAHASDALVPTAVQLRSAVDLLTNGANHAMPWEQYEGKVDVYQGSVGPSRSSARGTSGVQGSITSRAIAMREKFNEDFASNR